MCTLYTKKDNSTYTQTYHWHNSKVSVLTEKMSHVNPNRNMVESWCCTSIQLRTGSCFFFYCRTHFHLVTSKYIDSLSRPQYKSTDKFLSQTNSKVTNSSLWHLKPWSVTWSTCAWKYQLFETCLQVIKQVIFEILSVRMVVCMLPLVFWPDNTFEQWEGVSWKSYLTKINDSWPGST